MSYGKLVKSLWPMYLLSPNHRVVSLNSRAMYDAKASWGFDLQFLEIGQRVENSIRQKRQLIAIERPVCSPRRNKHTSASTHELNSAMLVCSYRSQSGKQLFVSWLQGDDPSGVETEPL